MVKGQEHAFSLAPSSLPPTYETRPPPTITFDHRPPLRSNARKLSISSRFTLVIARQPRLKLVRPPYRSPFASNSSSPVCLAAISISPSHQARFRLRPLFRYRQTQRSRSDVRPQFSLAGGASFSCVYLAATRARSALRSKPPPPPRRLKGQPLSLLLFCLFIYSFIYLFICLFRFRFRFLQAYGPGTSRSKPSSLEGQPLFLCLRLFCLSLLFCLFRCFCLGFFRHRDPGLEPRSKPSAAVKVSHFFHGTREKI
ncbi:hypothetical protein BC628DRAFT_1199798 [Trametes gibbosa]|nr:hypothetical protein BC628DRAFT_1199798 [Trametes gibbosa]